ncbi:MAG: hypothetical protein HY902_07510 [Deltaproteobacteria bacterium]|nr:hypothetical protein [Deltaproteobacteria bacterium]
MRSTSILLAASLALLCGQNAYAEAKDKCNGAEGIAADLLAACNQSAYDRCRPGYTKRCVDGVVKSFQEQTKEAGKAAAGAKETAAEGVCDTDAFVAECTKANAYAKEVCNETGTPIGDPKPEKRAKWQALWSRAPEAKAYWAAFAPKYPKCTRSVFKCYYSDFDREACEKVEDTFRGKWAEYRKNLADTVERARQDVAALAKNPFDWAAASIFDTLPRHLEEAAVFAAIPYLKADASEIAGWSTWLGGEKAKWQANREAALDKVKCPEPTNKDKALTATLRKVLDEHGKTSRDPKSTLVETVATFGLTGKAVQSHEAVPPITHEDQGGFGCVKQDKDGKQTCRVLKFTFRRSKPAGGSFGAWGFYSVGGGDEMACKNLK